MLRDAGLSTGALAFPILADAANVVSATYGVAFQMNIHTEWSNRPATFIVDPRGLIRWERRGKTFGDRPAPDDLLTVLKRLQLRQAGD